MPLRNRVTPLGELIADPRVGSCTATADASTTSSVGSGATTRPKRWIGCRLSFRGWHREPLMQPGRFTELFFLDEATAFAAGHRPCALCRREDYVRLQAIWRELHPELEAGADAIDARLHAERFDTEHGTAAAPRGVRSTSSPTARSCSVRASRGWSMGAGLRRWTPAGYVDRAPRPASGSAPLITPPSLVALLRSGWQPLVPLLHPSAS